MLCTLRLVLVIEGVINGQVAEANIDDKICGGVSTAKRE